MVSVLCALLMSAQSYDVTLEPTDDVWIYQFAEDQSSDEFLRTWGSDEGAVGSSFEGHLSFSYSCLKFSLPMSLPGSKLKSAKLVLMHTPDPGWSAENGEKHPVEVRSVTTNWDEKSWTNEMSVKVHPSADAATIYGTAWVKPPESSQAFKFEIELMKDKSGFSKAFDVAVADPNRTIGLALTSTLQPEGENSVYKFYSRSNAEELRPKLVLTFDPK